MSALGCLHEVYGVRKISFNEAKRTVKVEYDVSRLAMDDISSVAARSRSGYRQPIIAVNGHVQEIRLQGKSSASFR
jgi:copper chaperone CopZ